MKQRRQTLLFHFSLVLLLVLAACAAPSPLTRQADTVYPSEAAQAQTGPYQGPVSLKIDTGLSEGRTGKIIDLGSSDVGDFSVQAAGQTTPVFEETLNATIRPTEVSRTFKVSDTASRYTLLVERTGPTSDVEVNLNGTTWIRPTSFFPAARQAQASTLLLYASNSLRIRTWGTGKITVKILPGGSAGTVFRRQQGDDSQILNQEQRLRRNDVNIFNPNDPGSLGGLMPYEGDLPAEAGSPYRLGSSIANGSRARLYVGLVTAVLRPPVAEHLGALKSRFPVKVLEEYDSLGDHFVTLEVQFDAVNLADLAPAINLLNQRANSPPLTDAVFSSVNLAKTVTVAAELQARAQDLIYAVSLENTGVKNGGAIETQEQLSNIPTRYPSVPQSTSPPSVPVKASDLWWLNAIHAREAWNYSMGSNATVAVLDSGFGIVQDNLSTPFDERTLFPKPPDFRDRVVFHPDSIGHPLNPENYLRNCVTGNVINDIDCAQSNLDEALLVPGEPSKLHQTPGHGLWNVSLIASGDNDKNGIVGVAPRAKILPMEQISGVEKPISAMLERLERNFVKTPVDVVSISISREMNLYDFYFASAEYADKVRQASGIPLQTSMFDKEKVRDLDKTPEVERLFGLIAKLSREKKVVFVAAAGNNDHLTNFALRFDSIQSISIPAAMNYVIAVGGYKLVGGQAQRANFTTLGSLEPGSNWGSRINIWAPGKDIWVQGQEIDQNSPTFYNPKWTYVEGTSFAAPQVAGTVALMKSMNKNLDYNDVQVILNNTGTLLTHDSFFQDFTCPKIDPNQVDVLTPAQCRALLRPVALNALEAVKSVAGSKAASTFCLEYQSGQANSLTTYPSLTTFLPDLQPHDFVRALGWSHSEYPYISPNNFEVIQAEKTFGTTCGGRADFNVLSVGTPAGGSEKADKWLVRDSNGLKVNPDQYLGIAIDGRDLHGIQVLIDGEYQSLKEIADNYVILNQMPNLTPGLKDVILKFAGGEAVTLEKALEIISLPRMQEVQSIPTSAASRFASFRIGGDTFLAVTNSYDQPPPHYDLSTELYRWNGTQFVPFQSIPTNGAFAVEPFTLGNDHFLAIAEYTAEGVFEVNSHILKWDGTHFAPFQSILTHGATGWKHFEINGEHYLIVANHATGSAGYIVNVQTDSVLYKWNGNQFVAVQNLPTTAARDWEYLEVGQEKFLAVANEYDGFSYNSSTQIFSEIFKWDGSQFNSFQKIHSEGARDWKAFTIGDRHFLALANLWGATNSPLTAEKAAVYEYVNGRFEVAQTFDSAVMSWDHIQQEGRDYLLAAADARGTQMYLWNGTQWQLHQAITTDPAYDGLFFPIGDQDYYVSVSVYYANGSYHANSKVYKFE